MYMPGHAQCGGVQIKKTHPVAWCDLKLSQLDHVTEELVVQSTAPLGKTTLRLWTKMKWAGIR